MSFILLAFIALNCFPTLLCCIIKHILYSQMLLSNSITRIMHYDQVKSAKHSLG